MNKSATIQEVIDSYCKAHPTRKANIATIINAMHWDGIRTVGELQAHLDEYNAKYFWSRLTLRECLLKFPNLGATLVDLLLRALREYGYTDAQLDTSLDIMMRKKLRRIANLRAQLAKAEQELADLKSRTA